MAAVSSSRVPTDPRAEVGLPEFRSASSYEIHSAPCGSLLLMPPAGNPQMDGPTNSFHLCLEGLNAQMIILFPWYPFCANERSSCQRGLKGFHALQSHPVQIFPCASNAQFTLARVLESRTNVSRALCQETVDSGGQKRALHAVVSWGSFRCYTVS